MVYRFSEDRTELAVGTLGDTQNNIPAELALIDLAQKQVKSFPVSANPGAIYQIAPGKLMVACSGFHNSQKYPSGIPLERKDAAGPAKLHWIDTASGATEVIQLEYSPLLIGQDQNDPDTFYAACANVYGDPNDGQQGITLGSIINSDSDRPAATFFKIVSGKIDASLKLPNQPQRLVQISSSSVCLQGEKDLSIIDVAGPASKLLEYRQDQEIEEFLFNNEGTIGYLANVNSNNLNLIDLRTGKKIKTLKISNSFYIGKLFFKFFGSGFPPVIPSPSAEPGESINRSANRRMFFSKDLSCLYILAGAPEVSVIDLQTNEVKAVIKFNDTQYGIHPAPGGKYIVVAAENGWHLLDPSQTKPVLSLNLKPEELEKGPEYGYYSPDGNLLVIAFKNYLYLIDPVQGVSLGKIRTKAGAPLIVWPE